MVKGARVEPKSDTPIQPVDRPILCSPWAEPTACWQYDRDTGEAREIPVGAL